MQKYCMFSYVRFSNTLLKVINLTNFSHFSFNHFLSFFFLWLWITKFGRFLYPTFYTSEMLKMERFKLKIWNYHFDTNSNQTYQFLQTTNSEEKKNLYFLNLLSSKELTSLYFDQNNFWLNRWIMRFSNF